ncbi:MAG: hypothetical protein K2M17_03330, partial [Bacilli bacterium]|nr:hypothetical protein [Bacilli bacterium]
MKNILAEELTILEEPTDDNKNPFFTKELFKKWYDDLYDCARYTVDTFKENSLGHLVGVNYDLNPILLREVIYDAIIGLKKIVKSDNNRVEKPSAFKIAAHLGYWIVRHKPIMFLCFDENIDLNNYTFMPDIQSLDEMRRSTIWEMKHINELFAVNFMLRYIFDTNKKAIICKTIEFKKVKKTGTFCFDSFPEMGNVIADLLKYHLAYRSISPEVLEHVLEGYTLHPNWKMTGNLWSEDEDENKRDE